MTEQAAADAATTDTAAATTTDAAAPDPKATAAAAADAARTTDTAATKEGAATTDAPAKDAAGDTQEGEKDGDTKPKEGEAEAADAAEGAPESYDFKMPDGVEMNNEVLAEFSEIAKELNLPQDKAQSLVDIAAKKLLPSWEAALADRHAAQVETWATEARADKDIGGDAFDENVRVAQSAIAAYGSDGFKQLLDTYGLGNHPEFIRFCRNVGKELAEDKVPRGGDAPVGSKRTDAELFYPSMAKKP